MHPQPQPTCTTRRRVQAPRCPLFSSWVWRHRAGRKVRLGADAPCSAAAPAPRPRQRRRHRQAGVTLGSDRGSHSLVGFLLESPEGREKGSEKGHLAPMACRSPNPQRHSDPKHQLHGAVARVVRAGHSPPPTERRFGGWWSHERLALLTHHGATIPPSSMHALRSNSLIINHSPPLLKCMYPWRKVKVPCGQSRRQAGSRVGQKPKPAALL